MGAMINPGNQLLKQLVAALGLEGRAIRRITIDAAVKDVVRVTVEEFIENKAMERVIELVAAAEKREVKPKSLPKLNQSVTFRHSSLRSDRAGTIVSVADDGTCSVEWRPTDDSPKVITWGVTFVENERMAEPNLHHRGVCFPVLLCGFPIFFTDTFPKQHPVKLADDYISPYCTLDKPTHCNHGVLLTETCAVCDEGTRAAGLGHLLADTSIEVPAK